MQRLAMACEAIAGTTKKLLKTGIVADYLKSLPPVEGPPRQKKKAKDGDKS